MINYKKINTEEAQSWNNKLLSTNASYFQYPYYGEGLQGLPKSSVSYFVLYDNKIEIGFVTVLDIKYGPIKIGIITRGPAIIESEYNQSIITNLKKIQKEEGYLFLRLNPNLYDKGLIALLEKDKSIDKKDYFPLYKGAQDRDFIVKIDERNEDAILKSYKPRARQKIRFAGEEEFNYYKSCKLSDMEKVYEVFLKLSDQKDFAFRPLISYKKILENGAKYGLAELHIIEEKGTIVNAVLVLKDKNTTNNFSGGLIAGNYRPRNSPGAFLHHQIIKECLLEENKSYYNISYTAPEHPVYEFKTLFNPEKLIFPKTYCITRNKLLLNISMKLFSSYFSKLRKYMRAKHGNKK